MCLIDCSEPVKIHARQSALPSAGRNSSDGGEGQGKGRDRPWIASGRVSQSVACARAHSLPSHGAHTILFHGAYASHTYTYTHILFHGAYSSHTYTYTHILFHGACSSKSRSAYHTLPWRILLLFHFLFLFLFLFLLHFFLLLHFAYSRAHTLPCHLIPSR